MLLLALLIDLPMALIPMALIKSRGDHIGACAAPRSYFIRSGFRTLRRRLVVSSEAYIECALDPIHS